MTRYSRSTFVSRRSLLGAAAMAATFGGSRAYASSPGAVQGFPKSPIRVVVPYPPGGPTDVVGRVVTARLGEALGQPIVVDNKAGASGMVGAAMVAKAPADGYTLLVNASIHVINPYVYASAPYDAFRDFEPVTQLVDVPLVLVVGNALPARSLQELIAHARAHPGQVNFGSAGNASSQHLSGELFRLKTGAQMQHVPYKGSSPALTDLMGGQIQLMFDSMPSAMPFIASGRLRALAVTSARRSPSLPDVPTMEEAGMPGFHTSTWYGLWAPRSTPEDVVRKLWSEARKVLDEPQVAAQYRRLGAEPVGSTPAEFARYIQAEARKWEEIVKASGARAD
ncbi:Argininosuccinate lyase [Delftia tsuruhatensis]|uniref:Bug family tripartite tricarboxylate transporter substrate binding protein n=1 Tax=Delftia tsuruhatensis TaxID=180282 RepID=UPI001E715701|nr:tripartite tricarboxylate transporter substrate binding protein [Delftia tsuruhatensis]CAB5682533.1 Argininosuccinate lyase [Delftia tsuruhatensis]CAC9675806.1 Argininosuccinate lyase [Delftia tsuruhatensis]